MNFANFVSALHTEKLGNGDNLPKPKEIKKVKERKITINLKMWSSFIKI